MPINFTKLQVNDSVIGRIQDNIARSIRSIIDDTANLSASLSNRGLIRAGVIQLTGSHTNYSITSTAQHLILSSSAGSTVFISGNLGLSGTIGNADWIQFNTNFVDGNAEGRLQWNSDDGTLEFGLPGGNVNLQVGQEQLVRVRNVSGVQIDNGKVVVILSASAQRPVIGLASNLSSSQHPIGVATENIGHNSNGYVNVQGIIRDIDTSAFTEGDELFLGENGGLVNVRPIPPKCTTSIGTCIYKHATDGAIYCHVNHFPHLDELSNVLITSVQDGDRLTWNASTLRWENNPKQQVTGSTNFFTTNRLDSQGVLLNSSGSLILSSSAGSVIAASASLDFTNTDKAYHIRARGQNLILSGGTGTVGTVYVSGVLTTSHNVVAGTHVSVGSTSNITFTTRTSFASPANGLLQIGKNNLLTGSTLDVSTNNVLSLKDFGNTTAFLYFGAVNGITGSITAPSSSLVLSSSAGSVVAVSASLDLPGNDKAYHIKANNSHLILSSSAGGVVAASASLDFPNDDKAYHIRSVNSDLILSSSAGSLIAFSSSQHFVETAKPYHIRSVNDHLILTSSVGSKVYVSGNLGISGKVGIGIATPLETLHLSNSQNADTSIEIENNDTGTGAYTQIIFKNGANLGYLFQNSAAQTAYAGTGSLNIGLPAGERDFGIVTNNTARIIVKAGGNVGIGTATPFCGIDNETGNGGTFGKFGSNKPVYIMENCAVGLNVYYDTGWKFGKGSSTSYGAKIGVAPTTGHITFDTTDAGNAAGTATLSTKMTVLQGGNVGIGIAAPAALLHVSHGSSNTINGIQVEQDGTGTAQESVLSLMTDGDNAAWGAATNKGWRFSAFGAAHSSTAISNDLALRYWNGTTNKEIMFWGGDGSVGIGTVSPTANYSLHIYNASDARAKIETAAADKYSTLDFTTNGTDWQFFAGASGVATAADQNSFGIYNITTTSYALRLSASNNVAIGTDAPAKSAKLDIQGTTGALLLPRLTDAQKDALTPTAGMLIYNVSSGSACLYTTTWKLLSMT